MVLASRITLKKVVINEILEENVSRTVYEVVTVITEDNDFDRNSIK